MNEKWWLSRINHDFEDEDIYIDKPPEEAQRIKDFMRMRDDYFLEILEDLKPEEIETKLAELKALCQLMTKYYWEAEKWARNQFLY